MSACTEVLKGIIVWWAVRI